MRFYFYNHQNKGLPLVHAMQAVGWDWTAQAGTAQMVFSDMDVKTRVRSLDSFRRRGAKIFLYPHAARPNLFNDFEGYPPYAHTAASFVVADGHVEILQAIGLKHHFEITGWYLCPMKPFQPRETVRRVLFAPIHPNNIATRSNTIAPLSKPDMKINADTYRKLLALVEAGQIDLTVRYMRGLENNGLWPAPNVTFLEGQPDQCFAQIDEADLVVSHQTFAYIAIARGVPTVMMGESIPPRVGLEGLNTFQYVMSWDKYKHLMMYPLDILAEDDTLALFQRAAASDREIADWRKRHIGSEPFDPVEFVRKVKKYL